MHILTFHPIKQIEYFENFDHLAYQNTRFATNFLHGKIKLKIIKN